MRPRSEPNQVRNLMMGKLLFTPDQSKLMRVQDERECKVRAENPLRAAHDTGDHQAVRAIPTDRGTVGNSKTEVSPTTSESTVNRRRCMVEHWISRRKNPPKLLRNLVLQSVEERRGCF